MKQLCNYLHRIGPASLLTHFKTFEYRASQPVSWAFLHSCFLARSALDSQPSTTPATLPVLLPRLDIVRHGHSQLRTRLQCQTPTPTLMTSFSSSPVVVMTSPTMVLAPAAGSAHAHAPAHAPAYVHVHAPALDRRAPDLPMTRLPGPPRPRRRRPGSGAAAPSLKTRVKRELPCPLVFFSKKRQAAAPPLGTKPTFLFVFFLLLFRQDITADPPRPLQLRARHS